MMEITFVDNAIVFDYWTSEVGHEEPDIGCTDPNILVENRCTDDERHVGQPMGGTDFKYEGYACVEHHVIPTISQW
jgi:hypothetical protein